jgi:uncharacterized protein YegP (UPF0339 family)
MATEAKIYFEIESAVGGYVWRIRRHGNHEILCSSEILKERSTCTYAMGLVRAEAHTKTTYWDRNKKEWVRF